MRLPAGYRAFDEGRDSVRLEETDSQTRKQPEFLAKVNADNERLQRIQNDFLHVLQVLADDQNIPIWHLRTAQSRQARRLRRVAAYLTSITFSHPITTIATLCNMSRMWGVKAGREVEDAREDPAIDAWLTLLERRCLK